MMVTTFGIVGSGWRAEFFRKLAGLAQPVSGPSADGRGNQGGVARSVVTF
jgi:hypothetical protein